MQLLKFSEVLFIFVTFLFAYVLCLDLSIEHIYIGKTFMSHLALHALECKL